MGDLVSGREPDQTGCGEEGGGVRGRGDGKKVNKRIKCGCKEREKESVQI